MARLKIFGNPDERTLGQLQRCAQQADFAVLCADSHVGYSQPIGAAVAYEHHISPSGAGYDIGCGNKATRTKLRAEDIDVPRVIDEIVRQISFGIGRSSGWRVDHPVLDRIGQAEFRPQRRLEKLAREQLGTVGGGNHYVDLLVDEDGLLWVGVHFGSRGFGHRTASGFLALSQGLAFDERARGDSMDAPPVLFDTRTDLGQAYIEAMTLAGDYAYAGRDLVVDKVLEILSASPTEEVHNHHNFCVAGTERVATPRGCKPIADIVAGDSVYAFDQDRGLVEAQVKGAGRSGRKPIHTIGLLLIERGAAAWSGQLHATRMRVRKLSKLGSP